MQEKAGTIIMGNKVTLWENNEGQWQIRTSDYGDWWEVNPADAEA